MDLNSDFVLPDPSGDEVKLGEGVVGKVGDMGREGKGRNEVLDHCEVKMGCLDRGSEGNGSIVSTRVGSGGGKGGAEGSEGLEGAGFGEGCVVAANGKGLVVESEDSFRSVDSSFSLEKGIGKDEALRGCEEREVVSPVKGDYLKSFEAKVNVGVHGGDGKEEDVGRVAEIGYGEREKDQNVEQGQVEEQSVGASGSMCGDVEHETLGTTGSVGQITNGIPAVEVKVVDRNESLHKKDLNVSVETNMETCDGLENQLLEVNVEAQTNENTLTRDYVPETGVSKISENELELFNSVIDLIPSVCTDGNVSSDEKRKSIYSELEFHDSDLVWGKVRSHPWWPGQIIDPSASSEKAKKHFKKGTYLIAYFWDRTFAWNEAPQIKPFLENFSQMEKQSNMEEFQDAIACALDDVSRRVELGLACSCISKEVYAKLKTQIIDNAGISEEARRRDVEDNSLSVASFEPLKLIKFIKRSAQSPYSRVDRLALVTSQAQLSAFYRWKGYSQLPQFNMLGGLLDDADILQLKEKLGGEVSGNALQVIKDEDLVQKSKGKDNSSRKRTDKYGDSARPSKKEKRLSDVVDDKYLSTPTSANGSEGKAGSKLLSQSSSKKRKAVDAMTDDSAVKQLISDSSTGTDSNSLQSKHTFKVGDRIRRVASQLSGSSPILKNYNATSTEAAVEDKGKVSERPQTEKLAEREYQSPDEMLSQLYVAAINPMNEDNLNSKVPCLSEFRNSICLERLSPEEEDQLPLEQLFGGKLGKNSARIGKKAISSGIAEKSESEPVPREQPSLKSQIENGESVPGAPTDKDASTVEPQSSLELKANLDSEQKDLSRTALILNFTNSESVPSEANLSKIFSCYGPLTDVQRKNSRATVVFRRRADAESAFSSTGKYSTFGPSLVSYRLKIFPSTPRKASASPKVAKRGRKGATSPEGSAAN